MNDKTRPTHTLQALLGALATITCEVAEHMEINSSAIGQDLMKTGDCSSDVMVKLQGFDRMRQQLTAVGDILEHCSGLVLNCDSAPHNFDDIVAQITMRQMRHRLQDELESRSVGVVLERAPDSEEVF